MLALGGCGGGDKNSSGTLAVTGIQARAGTLYGEFSLFDINGTELNRVDVSSDNCFELTIPARNTKTIVVRCIPLTATPSFNVINLSTLKTEATLTSTATSPANVTVTSVTLPSSIQIGKTQQFVINGTNLVNSTETYFNVRVDSTVDSTEGNRCGPITPVSRSDTSITFTCIPNHPQVSFNLTNGATKTLIRKEDLPTIPLPRVTMQTSLGDITLELNPIEAPITVVNFLQYVNAQYYDGTIFHRVLTKPPGSLGINQGGGFASNQDFIDSKSKAGLRDPIDLETTDVTGLSNVAGTIAMARGDDPNSATSQFYFNVVSNTTLDAVNQLGEGYAVFGRVLTGQSVLNVINTTTRTSTDQPDLPDTDVIILSATQTQ
jgi:peptidyl-prolyl cis-trans isomerase A (cyclophilin A)